MQLPALAIQQPDLGRTLAQIAAIKGQGLQNKLLESQIARQGQVSNLMSRAVGGDDTYNAMAAGGGPTPEAASMLGNAPSSGVNFDAMKKLAAMDPKAARQLTEAIGSMDEVQRKRFDQQNKIGAQLLLSVLSAPPEQQPMAYAQARAQAERMGVPMQGVPAQWNPQWAQRALLSMMAVDDQLKMQKAPETKEFKEGDTIVTKQWDPATRQWNTVGTARRYKPQEGGDFKPNTEPAKLTVDRQKLKDMGFPDSHPAIRAIDRKLAKTGEKTNAQELAAGFSDRMYKAESVLAGVESQGADFWGRLAEQFPGGNYTQSPEYQKFEQARRDFINAQLRRESGAVINPDEFQNADRQYFPQPGDTPEVIAQKRENRKTAIEAMKRSAGEGYEPPKIEPPKKDEGWKDLGNGVRIREKK